MVLCGKDHLFYACLPAHTHPLPGVELRGIEQRWVFCPGTPFAVGEGVDAKMKKSRQLQLLPAQLPW